MNAAREQTLENRYCRIKAYGDKVSAALPNAREVGLVAYVPIQQTHDAKIMRCSRILRAIENTLNDA